MKEYHVEITANSRFVRKVRARNFVEAIAKAIYGLEKVKGARVITVL